MDLLHHVLSAMLLLLLQGETARGQDTCDQCDCKLSHNDDERAIFNVRARCRAGSVEWTSAYGALRLELQPFLRGDFRLCFVLDSRHTLAQVSQETPASRHTSTPRLRNYRLRQEGDETLSFRRPGMTPLVTAEDGASREVCVTSRAGQPVLLYVEVQRTTRFTGLPSVVLQYDVEASSDAGLSDPMEECRPCTHEELLEAYCTSDFVAVGSIHQTRQPDNHVDSSDHTQVEVAVAQLVHQTSPVFQRVRRDDRFLYGTIRVPSKCGVRAGKGDFLFTGRMRLGKAKLRCAPYYEDWLKISTLAECAYD